jgi:hypothetical protein
MAREVKVAVVGDARQLQKELQKAERAVAGFGKNAKDSSEKLKSVFIGGAIAFGAKQIIDSASQLEAAVGGTAAIFGDAAVQIDKFSQSAAETAGLSEKAARDLTSKLGASLQGAGMDAEAAAKQAIFLTQTGADLAATLGGSTEEAVSALGGALRGEFDPLERFGIALKASDINAQAVAMGLADSESSVSAYAKQQATLAILTEKSAFAQKAFAKEAGTAEGAAKIAGAQLQDTSADIGKSFLPIYTKAAEIVGTLAKAFGALPDSVQVGVLAVGGAAVIGPKIAEGVKSGIDALKSIPGVINKVTDKLTSSKGMFEGFGTTAEMTGTKSANAAGAGGIGALGPAMLGVGAAVGIAAIFWMDYNKKQEEGKKNAEEFLATLDESTGGLTDQTDALIRNKLESKNQIDNLNNAGIAFDDYRNAIQDTTKISQLFAEVEKGSRRMRTESGRKAVINNLREEGGARNELIATLIEQGQLDNGLADTIMAQSKAYQDSLEVIRKRAEATALSAGADKEQAKAAGEAAKKNAENASAIKEQYENTLALLNSNIGFQQAQVASQKAIEEYNKGLSDGTISTLDRKEKDLALMSQFESTAAAAVKAAEDQAKLEGKTLSAGDAAKIQKDKLVELAGQVAPGSPVQYGLLLMISQLQGVIDRGRINIAISSSGITEAQAAIRELLGVDTLSGVRGKGLGFRIVPEGERANGGPVNAGAPYLVGERGPELFIPSNYGKIVDNVATMSMLSGGTSVAGGGVNVTINLPPGVNGDDVVDAIRRYERRNGPIFQAA